MDVWLQRNQQCPACRVTINPANPVKQILGGLNEAMDDKDRLSNPELRKARFDILYREYEEEFEKLYAENNLLKTENNILKQQLQRKGSDAKSLSRETGLSKTPDTNGLLLLTKKLQDAQRLYEKVKTELSRTKEENNSLKDENVNVNHENQKLRGEIANRSPHRYGRYTVSTLEAKIQSYEKEVSQLNKALEKSDKYIEEMQTELEAVRSKEKSRSDTAVSKAASASVRSYTRYLPADPPLTTDYRGDGSHKRQLFGEEGSDKKTSVDDKGYSNGESHKYDPFDDQPLHDRYKAYDAKPSSKTGTTSKNGNKAKRVTFDIPRDRNETMSFDLEMPSPMSSKLSLTNGSSDSPVKGVLKNKKSGETSDSFSLSKPSSLDDSLFEVRRKTTAESYSKEEEEDLFRPRASKSDYKDSFSLERPDRVSSGRHEQELDDTQVIQSELDELDISITPDFTECMKLLNRAEKKVHSHEDEEEDMETGNVYRSSQDYLGDYRTKSDPLAQDQKSEFKSYPKAHTLAEDYEVKDGLISYPKSDVLNAKSESAYSSKYYTSHLEEDFKSSVPSKSSYGGTQSDVESVGSKYRTLQSDTDLLGSRYRTSQSETDTLGSKYRTSLATGISYKSDVGSKTDNEQYSMPSSSTTATSASGDRYSDNYTTGGDDISRPYRRSDRLSDRPPTSGLSSSSKSSSSYGSATSSLHGKFSMAGKPLGQSGFGRSPSVDNLFMAPKSSQNTGSRYATAEDIPSFKSSRLSLPSYPPSSSSSKSSQGKFSTGSYDSGRKGRVPSGAMSDIATSQDYSRASLPPRPTRTRSYSDIGTTVNAYPRVATNQGKGSVYDVMATTDTAHLPDTPQDIIDDMSACVMPPFVASSVSQPPRVSAVSSVYMSQPMSIAPSCTYISHGDQGVSSRIGGGDANTITDETAYNTALVSSGRPKPSFSYTDVDLGVNPRNRGDYKSTVRTRSASLDVPVSKIMSNSANHPDTVGSTNNYPLPSSSLKYSSDIMSVAESDISALAFAGPSSRSTLESAYPSSSSRYDPAPSSSRYEPVPSSALFDSAPSSSRYSSAVTSSSTSTTSYLPTSLTASTTYSTAHPPSSSTYPGSSLTSYPSSTAPPPNSYTNKPLNLDSGTKGGFSYLSNNSSLGEFSKSDSYLPEPKKRLFESSDDFDISLSPIKATRKM